MKKPIIYLLLSMMLTGTLLSCKKYEDGPLISFIPADKRVSGAWKFESATQVQTGSGATPTDITSTYTNAILDVNEDNTGTYTNNSGTATSFTWQFDDKKKNFLMVFSGTTYTAKVLRLTNDEFWVEVKDFPVSGNTYVYHLTQ